MIVNGSYTYEPNPPRRLRIDHRPGHYYVSVVHNGRLGLLLGPFRYHRQALRFEGAARERAYAIDPWAWFYAIGTVRLSDGRRSGVLNGDLGIERRRR